MSADEAQDCYDAPVTEADPLIGRMVGPYRIDAVLGVGASGRVYRAEHLGLARRAAIKIFPERVLQPGQSRERFLREAGALTRVDHPNVVRLYDAAITESSIPYLAMEWIDGVPLSDAMRVGITAPRALYLASEIARGLEAIHAAGFVHRDLKPANVMLSAVDGIAKIVDFGIVKSEWFPTITAVDSIVGTPAFMAPEQLLESYAATAPADLYALGAILFLMFTGEPHVHAVGLHALIQAQLTEIPKPLAPTMGPCGALIDRMLDKEPSARPTAAEVAETFAAHAPQPDTAAMTRVLTEIRAARHAAGFAGDAVVPTPMTWSDGDTIASPRAPRSWRAVAVVGAVTAGLLAGAVAVTTIEREAQLPAPIAPPPVAPAASTPKAVATAVPVVEDSTPSEASASARRPAKTRRETRPRKTRAEAPEVTTPTPPPEPIVAPERTYTDERPPPAERVTPHAALAARIVRLGARNRRAGSRLSGEVARQLDRRYLDLRSRFALASKESTHEQLAPLAAAADAFERDLAAAQEGVSRPATP